MTELQKPRWFPHPKKRVTPRRQRTVRRMEPSGSSRQIAFVIIALGELGLRRGFMNGGV